MSKHMIKISLLVCMGWVYVVVTTAQVVEDSNTSEGMDNQAQYLSDPTRDRSSSDMVWPVVYASGNTAGVFIDTGADVCADVTVIPLPVGPPGNPSSITIFGDNTNATDGDCTGEVLVPVWWEGFIIEKAAIVRIDFCGTIPELQPVYYRFNNRCDVNDPCVFLDSARAIDSGIGAPVCSDGNSWMVFALEVGDYFYPVFSDESLLVNGRGPYQFNISAEEVAPPVVGPDVIVGHIANLDGLAQFGREGAIGSGTVGLGLSTTACNQGDQSAKWRPLPDTNHPVLTGNLYRLHSVAGSDRLEQIGQAWIKHGFGSANIDECGLTCTCLSTNGCDGGQSIGPGCSDTYGAGQFDPCGNQSIGLGLMGSRSVIHPYTGEMPEGDNLGFGSDCDNNFPSANHFGHNHVYPFGSNLATGISHRLQVQDVDLIPGLNPGVRYFTEGQYIVPDEYTLSYGTQNNNVSYREVDVAGPDIEGVFTFNTLTDTFDQSPAIDAWVGASQSMIEPVPLGDGRSFLVYEVTDLGGGQWHYEYGLYNMNMQNALHSITFPVPTGVTINNAGFHAPLNHAPETNTENYPNTPWAFNTGDGEISWSVATHADDPLANAVRWGTLYNFRFDADTPPQTQFASVGLYRTGQIMNVPTLVPQSVGPTDCNNNGIDDICDLDCNAAGCEVFGCGGSIDCDGTGVPDECEIDCNDNGIGDSCDIAADPTLDCTGNGILDECEADCNNNGITDLCEIFNRTVTDNNANGIPDICDVQAPSAEQVPIDKSRYLSFVPSDVEKMAAIRVTLTQLDGFGSFNSQVRWVGPPGEYPEGATPEPTLFAAGLQCTPHYQDWSGFEILHLFGSAIVPGSIYDIQFIEEGLDIFTERSYTTSLTLHTGKWGDIVEPFATPELTQPSIADVLSLVDKWLGNLDPTKARSQLQPNLVNPSLGVGIADVLRGVDAWLGSPYPFDGPSACP